MCTETVEQIKKCDGNHVLVLPIVQKCHRFIGHYKSNQIKNLSHIHTLLVLLPFHKQQHVQKQQKTKKKFYELMLSRFDDKLACPKVKINLWIFFIACKHACKPLSLIVYQLFYGVHCPCSLHKSVKMTFLSCT